MTPMPSQGILYIATGEEHIRTAMRSALSVRKHSPNLGIHLFADWPDHDFNFDKDPAPFTSVGRVGAPHRRSKVDYLPQTPFDQTLYLDNDSALNADVHEMFQLLERYDLALGHIDPRSEEESIAIWKITLPPSFPFYNSGVILYRKTPDVITFLETWRDAYKQAGLRRDETTLRELLWLSSLRLSILPPNYNARYSKYEYLFFKSNSNTKIYHLKELHGNWLGRVLRFPIRKIKKLFKS